MFRRTEDGLVKDHPDPYWSDDIDKLGCFITESGLLRKKDRPDQRYDYWITNHERYNEVHREAMQKCIRREVDSRMAQLGIEKLYMPQLVYQQPKDEPHIPIYAPPVEVLKVRKRVIIFINDDFQDLGLLAYRHLYGEGGFVNGTCVGTVKDLITRSSTLESDGDVIPAAEAQSRGAPALIVMNPGQLRYSHKYNRAMTHLSWMALPRKSIAHPPTAFNGDENTVVGHRTVEEHIQTVFEQVIGDARFVSPEAEIYVIAVSNGARATLDILDENWPKYSLRLTGLALLDPPRNYSVQDKSFKSFLKFRTRTWIKSDKSANKLLRTPFASLPTDLEVFDITKPEKEEESTTKSQHGTSSAKHDTDWLETVPQGVSRQQIKEIIGFGDSKTYLDHVKNIGVESVLASAGNSMINLGKAGGSAQSSFSDHDNGAEQSTKATTDASQMDLKARIEQMVDDTLSLTLYPTFSGGDPFVAEMLYPNVKKSVLDFFEEIAQRPTKYQNPEFVLTPETAAAEISDAIEALDLMDPGEAGKLHDELASLEPNDSAQEVERVPFAGAMVDPQLLEKAGLGETGRVRRMSIAEVGGNHIEQIHDADNTVERGKTDKKETNEDLRKDSAA